MVERTLPLEETLHEISIEVGRVPLRFPARVPWAIAMVLLGLGTALVYPTLLAVVSDVAHPDWRASAVGVYRLWRDVGYAVGAVLAGVVADRFGVVAAIAGVAGLTAASGLLVAVRMYETHGPRAARAAAQPPMESVAQHPISDTVV